MSLSDDSLLLNDVVNLSLFGDICTICVGGAGLGTCQSTSCHICGTAPLPFLSQLPAACCLAF